MHPHGVEVKLSFKNHLGLNMDTRLISPDSQGYRRLPTVVEQATLVGNVLVGGA